MPEAPPEYRVYGRIDSRASAALASVLIAKKLRPRFVEQTASLSWILEARSGYEEGPYLRTPEGFLLGGLHGILSWIERTHPEPALVPKTPVRRICTRLLEDWIELWLPRFAERTWGDLMHLSAHLDRSSFLLGSAPVRADWLLASWIETEVVVTARGRAALEERAPRLLDYGARLLDAEPGGDADDVLPISLLHVLEAMAGPYHVFLEANLRALKQGAHHVALNFGLGEIEWPVSEEAERRRTEIAEELRQMSGAERDSVRRVLEPVHAWHLLIQPPVLEDLPPADPRSL